MARRTPATLLLATRAAAHLAVIGIALVVAGCRTTSAPDAATTKPAAATVSRTTARAGLPDDRTIDTFTYSFTDRALQSPTSKPVIFGPAGSLGITRQGRVYYSYQTHPHTGSGGQTVSKQWDVPADEAATLLDAIIDDGLLNLEEGHATGHGVLVSRGRWQLRAAPTTMPASILARLRPYLDVGDAAFKEKYGRLPP